MTITVRSKIENGLIRLPKKVRLPDGTRVIVRIDPILKTKEKLKIISITNDRTEDAHFVTIGFLCKDFEGDARIKEPDEITEWRWFPLKKLPSPIYPPSAKVIEHYLDKRIY